jgi:hypothetical protein
LQVRSNCGRQYPRNFSNVPFDLLTFAANRGDLGTPLPQLLVLVLPRERTDRFGDLQPRMEFFSA